MQARASSGWRGMVAVVAGSALLVAACGDDGNDRATAGADAGLVGAVAAEVVALDNTFRPALTTVQVGEVVRWENRGMNDHDVLSVERGEWGIEIADFGPGATYAHAFTEPGEYRYFCSIHGTEFVGMVGTIVVEP